MDLVLILIIIGLGIVFFLAFKLFKKLFKAVISVIVILLVLIILSGIIIYNDAMTLKNGLSGDQIVMITHEEKIITAFEPTMDVPVSSIVKSDFYELLSEEEIEEIHDLVQNNKVEEIEEKGFLIIIEQKAFYNETIDYNNKEINMTQEILMGLGQSATKDEIINALSKSDEFTEEELLMMNNEEIHELKSQIYYALFAKKMKETKGSFLIKEIKNNNIITIPKLLSVKTLNFFPTNLIKRMIPGDK